MRRAPVKKPQVMKINQTLLTALAAGISTGLASSETIVADEADASVRSNGSGGQNTNNVLFAGSYYADGPGLSPVFPFLLPDLGEGDPFGSATLTLELESFLRGPVTFNGDITGIDRIADSPNVIVEDWGNSGSLLQDDFYTPNSEFGVSTTIDFATWLNAQYANGANAGRYVFIRVDAESAGERVVTGRTSYSIATANHQTLQKPTLNYTTASEEVDLEITEFKYNFEDESVTLTWRKTGADSYRAVFSLDMTNWGGELDDNIDDEDDESPEDADHLTVTFPLADIQNPSRAFFRVEEE